MRSYAIGDIHGQLSLLKSAHELIARDMERYGSAPVIHLGDLEDRGPASAGVIDYLMQGQQRGEDWLVLKGNHDRLFTRFMQDPWWTDPFLSQPLNWLHPRVGGAETMRSYGVQKAADRPVEAVHRDALAAVDPAHLAWLEALPLSHQRGEVFFVHAGIRPGIALADQAEDDLLWIRKAFLEDSSDHGRLIVHGHTAIETPAHFGNRVNIDSSAGYGGPVSAIVIEGSDVSELTPEGRRPLLPG